MLDRLRDVTTPNRERISCGELSTDDPWHVARRPRTELSTKERGESCNDLQCHATAGNWHNSLQGGSTGTLIAYFPCKPTSPAGKAAGEVILHT